MKKINLLFVMVTTVFFACQKTEVESDHSHEKGLLSLDLLRGDDFLKSSIPNISLEEFAIEIYKEDGGLFLTFDLLSEVPNPITLAYGNYYIMAHSKNKSNAKLNDPYFEGISPMFTIDDQEIKSVSVECSLAQIAVSVRFSDQVMNSFDRYECKVSNEQGDTIILNGEDGEIGYFLSSKLLIDAYLYYKGSNGQEMKKLLQANISEGKIGEHYHLFVDEEIKTQANLLVSVDTTAQHINYIVGNPLMIARSPKARDLQITEIMYDPSNLNDSEGEWIEIYNTSQYSIQLLGLEISRSNGSIHMIQDSLVLDPHNYAVLGRSETAAPNVNYVYKDISLTNTSDSITILLGSEIIDYMKYDESQLFPNAAGKSLQLNPSYLHNHTAKASDAWCLAKEVFESGDLGTPGTANSDCN